MLNEQQIADYHRDGFIVVDEFFSHMELAEFGLAFGRLINWRRVFNRPIGELYDICSTLPEFLRIVGKKDTALAVNQLLDRPLQDPMFGYTNRCLIQPPNDDSHAYGWHQEVFYTIPESRFVQTWAPLISDTTLENGTIEVCVGSHKEGIAEQTWYEPEQPGHSVQVIVAPHVVAKYEQRAIPMTLGQMLFFDGHLFHRSGKNTSSDNRYSLVGMYHDVDAKGFVAPMPSLKYRGKSPYDWYLERQRAGL